jgi:hypothetical protein
MTHSADVLRRASVIYVCYIPTCDDACCSITCLGLLPCSRTLALSGCSQLILPGSVSSHPPPPSPDAQGSEGDPSGGGGHHLLHRARSHPARPQAPAPLHLLLRHRRAPAPAPPQLRCARAPWQHAYRAGADNDAAAVGSRAARVQHSARGAPALELRCGRCQSHGAGLQVRLAPLRQRAGMGAACAVGRVSDAC